MFNVTHPNSSIVLSAEFEFKDTVSDISIFVQGSASTKIEDAIHSKDKNIGYFEFRYYDPEDHTMIFANNQFQIQLRAND